MDSRELPAVNEAFGLIAPPLTPLQIAAFDLYQRGLNVFPVPKPHEVRAWAVENPINRSAISKPPYLLKPLFTSRMHVCESECRQARGGSSCLPKEATFDALFYNANLAVMMGRTSGNLLDIDCDSYEAFERVGNELEQRNIPFWAFTSHRGGGYLLRLAEGEAANAGKNKTKIPDVEVWGNSHYAVLPPSFHPLGTVYQWKTPDPYYHLPMSEPPPLTNLEDLSFLGVKLAMYQKSHREETDLYDLPEWTIHLSRPNRMILASTLVEGERNTQLSKATYDVAALINREMVDYQEGERVLVEAARRSNYPVDSILQMLNSALKKKPTPAKEYKNSDAFVPSPWQVAQAFGLAFDWNVYGRRAQSRRAVFFACVERSKKDSSPIFRASVREVAELSNYNKETIQAALRELEAGGPNGTPPPLLVRKGKSEQSSARLFAFTKYVMEEGAHKPYSNTPSCNDNVRTIRAQKQILPTTGAEQDVFYRQRIAFRVWMHLKHTPESKASAIACAEGLKPDSVRRALKWLVKHSLVTFGPAEGMYYGEHLTEESLEQLAAALGTLGRSAKRKWSHERDRGRRINLSLARERERWLRRLKDWHLRQMGNSNQ